MRISDALIIINEIKKLGYKLNDWERGILKSIVSQNKDITVRQGQILQEIYARSAGGGIYQQRLRCKNMWLIAIICLIGVALNIKEPAMLPLWLFTICLVRV